MHKEIKKLSGYEKGNDIIEKYKNKMYDSQKIIFIIYLIVLSLILGI